MVGATSALAERSETKSDAELIAEIAPPMLAKLREDGELKGAFCSVIPLLLFVSFFRWELVGPLQTQLKSWVILLLILLALALPFFFKRRSVLNEVRYRRQHGKWRWER
jgi:hypothetical protein